jgi:hypothetical protein
MGPFFLTELGRVQLTKSHLWFFFFWGGGLYVGTDHRAANNEEFTMYSPSYVFVLSTDGDLSNTNSACAPPPNVAGRGEVETNCWQTHSVQHTSMLAQVERDGPLSILFLCSVVQTCAVVCNIFILAMAAMTHAVTDQVLNTIHIYELIEVNNWRQYWLFTRLQWFLTYFRFWL